GLGTQRIGAQLLGIAQSACDVCRALIEQAREPCPQDLAQQRDEQQEGDGDPGFRIGEKACVLGGPFGAGCPCAAHQRPPLASATLAPSAALSAGWPASLA